MMGIYSRRLFLQSSASALLLPFTFCKQPESNFLQLQFDFLKRSNDGSLEKLVNENMFLQRAILLPIKSQRIVVNVEEKELAEHYLRERVISETYANFNSRVIGFHINDFCTTSYGIIPEPITKYALQYQNYCRYATEFLYSQEPFKKLPLPPVTWQQPSTIPKGDIPAFVGHSYLINYKFLVQLQLEDGRKIGLEVSVPKPEGGGRIIGQRWHIDKEKQEIVPANSTYTILVSTYSERSLQIPFSEITCLLFAEGINKYIFEQQKKIDEKDYFSYAKKVLRNAERLRETITESVSLYMTTQIIRQHPMQVVLLHTSKKDIEDKGLGLAKLKRKSGELYQNVPRAYKYLQRFGLNHTIDLFLSNPSQYLNEVKAT